MEEGRMPFQSGEIDSELTEHTMLSLIMAVFIFYVTTSLGLYFAKTLSPESFYSLSLSCVLVLWAFKEHVVDFISPALLRLFGVGGQGYLHLLSLWFVDPRDLTLVGVASRVLAGSYTAILAAIFFVPLLFAVFIYIMNLSDALSTHPSSALEVDHARPSSATGIEETSAPRPPNRVSVSSEAPMVFEPAIVDDEERWLLTDFDMAVFQVLCPLGRGVTSNVVLAKVDFAKATERIRHDHGHTQNGSFFGGAHDEPNGHDQNKVVFKQEGSFWADVAGGGMSGSTSASAVPDGMVPPPFNLDTELADVTTVTQVGGGGGQIASEDTAKDLFDDVLSEIEERLDDDTAKRINKHELQHVQKPFGPGGGPVVSNPVPDVGWRRLEPDTRVTSPARPVRGPSRRTSVDWTVAHPPPSPSLAIGSLSRQSSRASSSTNNNIDRTWSVSKDLKGLAGATTAAESTYQKLRNSQSMTRLSEMAGELPDGEDAWWRPLQWLDEVQRKKSGMDEVFAVAPGLAEARNVSISDFAYLADRGRFPSSSSKASLPKSGSRSSLAKSDEPMVSNNGPWKNSNGPDSEGQLPSTEGGVLTTNNGTWRGQSEGRSPKLVMQNGGGVKFNVVPSVLSMGGDSIAEEQRGEGVVDEDDPDYPARRLLDGLDEMPDLVAIKIMRKSDIERMQLKKTVENERRALAMCASPFVCNIFGAFQDAHWAYILLEPVPAGDLAGLLEQRQVMFEDEAMFYVGCLLLALEHLHARGIVCLDVKPENLLLDQYGYCKLCDLGIARISSSGSSANRPTTPQNGTATTTSKHWEFVGTPEYMSPEVIGRNKIAQGIPGIAGPDLWACGVLLFELLSGETPFAGDTNAEVVGKIQRFVAEERSATNATLSRYQRWTRRRTDEDEDENQGGKDEDAVTLPSSADIERVFYPIEQKSSQAKELIRKLLRSDPKKRLGCRGDGARNVMEHAWFTTAGFDWRSLTRREMKAPFVPNPLTLAPPFRGEQVEVDITRERPLSVLELQQCQDFLKGHPVTRAKHNSNRDDQAWTSWKGFIPIEVEPADLLDRKSRDFTENLMHVQRLFRDEVE